MLDMNTSVVVPLALTGGETNPNCDFKCQTTIAGFRNPDASLHCLLRLMMTAGWILFIDDDRTSIEYKFTSCLANVSAFIQSDYSRLCSITI